MEEKFMLLEELLKDERAEGDWKAKQKKKLESRRQAESVLLLLRGISVSENSGIRF
ncbi:MAG: hypothetical protein ACLRMZ_15445 [Blautia marasmi]